MQFRKENINTFTSFLALVDETQHVRAFHTSLSIYTEIFMEAYIKYLKSYFTLRFHLTLRHEHLPMGRLDFDHYPVSRE